MLDTLPLTLRYIDKRLADGFVVDSAVFFVLIVVTVALYVVVQNWGPTRILFHASLLASVAFFLLCVVSVLEYWYSLKTHLVIVWLKSVNLLLALVVVCSVVVPIMTTRAVEVLPTMVHSLFFECTCAACVVLLVVNYPLFLWLSTLVHSAVCSYVIPLVVYATTCILSKVMADYATYPSEEIDVLVGYVI